MPRRTRWSRRSGSSRTSTFRPSRIGSWDRPSGCSTCRAARRSPARASRCSPARAPGWCGRSRTSCSICTPREHGYTEIAPPLLVNRAIMTGTGQLPKFEEELYLAAADDLFLIPDRRGAGNQHLSGRDSRRQPTCRPDCAPTRPVSAARRGPPARTPAGLIRVHQFDKVELVRLCRPEDSPAEHEKHDPARGNRAGAAGDPVPAAGAGGRRHRVCQCLHLRSRSLGGGCRHLARGLERQHLHRLPGPPGQHPVPAGSRGPSRSSCTRSMPRGWPSRGRSSRCSRTTSGRTARCASRPRWRRTSAPTGSCRVRKRRPAPVRAGAGGAAGGAPGGAVGGVRLDRGPALPAGCHRDQPALLRSLRRAQRPAGGRRGGRPPPAGRAGAAGGHSARGHRYRGPRHRRGESAVRGGTRRSPGAGLRRASWTGRTRRSPILRSARCTTVPVPAKRQLTALAILQALILVTIVAVGLAAYRNAMTAQRDRLWVAMAREAAHQMGTPLMSLQGWIEQLRSRATPAAAAGGASRGGRRAAGAGGPAIRADRPRDPARADRRRALAAKVADYFRPRLPSRVNRIELRVDAAGDGTGGAGRSDPARMGDGVAGEERHRCAAGPGRHHHPSGRTRRPDAAAIRVADDGPGIPGELRRTIFEPGITTKSSGWGIGLALARRVVEDSHGGELMLEHERARRDRS